MCKSSAGGIHGVVYHPYLTDQLTIEDLIQEVKRSECPHNSLDSDHIFGDKLRVRRKNFNYWPREVRLNIINGEENAYRKLLSKSSLNMGLIGSETMSLCQIEGKSC